VAVGIREPRADGRSRSTIRELSARLVAPAWLDARVARAQLQQNGELNDRLFRATAARVLRNDRGGFWRRWPAGRTGSRYERVSSVGGPR
jgi:hypothetical protein